MVPGEYAEQGFLLYMRWTDERVYYAQSVAWVDRNRVLYDAKVKYGMLD